MKQNAQSLKIWVQNHNSSIMQISLATVVFLLGRWRLSEVGQPILFNDEYGYWANSAYLMGEDWSSVTSRIGYYSYGYSLLLVPLRYLAQQFWWNWDILYQSAVVLNALMLVGSYLLSMQICRRFFKDIHCIVQNLVCFAAIIYPSNLIYAHITWTENALTFAFWVFLYVLMRVADKPTVWNHIGFAVVSVYIFTIHQRALAIPITAVIVVVFMKIVNCNQLRQVAAFLGSMLVCISIHSIIKGGLQNDFYLGNRGRAEGLLIGWNSLPDKITIYILNKKMLILLAAALLVLVLLTLLEKGKVRFVVCVLLFAVMAGIAVIVCKRDAFFDMGTETANRLAHNDFAGQWGKLQGIFSKEGLKRLIISMIGKWFYLASGTGLVICWGMWMLLKHGVWMIGKGISRMDIMLRNQVMALKIEKQVLPNKTILGKHTLLNRLKVKLWNMVHGKYIKKRGFAKRSIQNEDKAYHIWLVGVFLSWAGTFMIVAIYKEGFYKVDDLLHGRYNEFLIGVLLIYSFYCLIKDKKWYITGGISLLLYVVAGSLCQHALNTQQNAVFELAHSTMLGKVFWNWDSLEGKMLPLGCYALLLGGIFIGLIKLGTRAEEKAKLPKTKLHKAKLHKEKLHKEKLLKLKLSKDKICIVIQCAAFLVPILVWQYLAMEIVDGYVIKRNDMQAYAMPQTAMRITSLNMEVPVYFLEDTVHYRYAEGIQFMLQEQPVTLTDMENAPFEEDAFFIMGTEYTQTAVVAEQCEVIYASDVFSLLVNREGKLIEWREILK